MSLWLVRAGSFGEHESKFLDNNRIYLTWGELASNNLTAIEDYDGIKERVTHFHSGESPRKLGNWSGQIWAFVLAMKIGDWVVVPSKSKPTIAIGEIKSVCQFDDSAPNDYRHFREVQWLKTDIPRNHFEQDLLYSFGAFMTICEIKRNDAEQRVRAMAKNGWRPVPTLPIQVNTSGNNVTSLEEEIAIDFEQLARDTIAKQIIQKFQGHGMARLVEAVLKAQGFTTYLSPEGADKGIDILAAGGAFGFNAPKICVQVKSGDTPADRPEFTQLIGAMQNVQADHGLFVSWSGFKTSVLKETPVQFFRVRLWNQNDLIEQLLANYENLDQDIRTEIPLKQIWTIATPQE
jgi:restriction system protein